MEAILDAPSPVDGRISIRKWMEESERELFVKKLDIDRGEIDWQSVVSRIKANLNNMLASHCGRSVEDVTRCRMA